MRSQSICVPIETLEPRRLFSAIAAQPTYRKLKPNGSATPTAAMFTPQAIRAAYGFDKINLNGIVADGAGQTVAIIDAYDNPNFVSTGSANFNNSDLHKFNVAFGLPDPPSFIKVNQSGGSSYPAYDVGWAGEIALDVEWVHALAPAANIVLVEANSASYDDLIKAAANYARNRAGVSVVSMSFGGGEIKNPAFLRTTQYDTYFTTPAGHQGVTFVASTGDDGAPGGYPAYSPNVVAVGGTSLNADHTTGAYSSETSWNNQYGATGGGISIQEAQPSYQTGVVTQSSTLRTIPDLSLVADPVTGVAVCDTANGGAAGPWLQYGGTSLSAPCIAAMIAIADQARVANGLTTMDGRNTTLPRLYQAPAGDYHDITSGTNNGYSAGAGYDLVTGRGTPKANLLLNDLSGVAPGLLVPAALDLLPASDLGISTSDNITNDNTPTFTGTALAGSTVNLFAGANQVGSGVVDGNGNWSITSSALTDATYNFTAKSTNGTSTTASSAPLNVTIDTISPTVDPGIFNVETGQSLTYHFSEALGVWPTSANIVVQNLTLTSTVNTSVSYDGALRVGTCTFPNGILADGNYQATLSPSGAQDLAGNSLSAGDVSAFFVLAGDANRNRIVNALDFNVLASRYGQSGTFTQADFNYNGIIDSADFAALAANFGVSLAAPDALPIPPPAAAETSPLFSDQTVTDSGLQDVI